MNLLMQILSLFGSRDRSFGWAPHSLVGKRIRLSVKQHQRAARKARNQRRNRVSHRG